MNLKNIFYLVILLLVSVSNFAQEFDIDLQIRPRYEFRNGYKKPMAYGVKASQFISQRSRIALAYGQEKLTTKLTLQNIRVWGDVKSTATSDVNGIEVFEAWANYNFTEKWSAKLGRQIISYDNQRIFGEIDWLQQGQSHDAIVMTYNNTKSQINLGIAYNANGESLIEEPYLVANYKSFQYARYHTYFSKINVSLLFLNTGYENKPVLPITALTVDYIQTFGTYLNSKGKNWDSNLSFYGQTGKSTGNTVSAFDVAINFNYALTEKFKIGCGYEFLSGKSQRDTSTDIKSFYPLFGTNHAFNGYMDYFYVGNYQNSVGLHDVFLKFLYNIERWQFAAIPHFFNAGNTVENPEKMEMNSYLGTEIDFTFQYTLNKYIKTSGGYSQMWGTETLENLKGADTNHNNNWAWVMVNVDPKIFSFKK